MKAEEKRGYTEIEGVRDFNCDQIFDCGQCFRWEKNHHGGYSGAAFGRVVSVYYDAPGELLRIYGADLEDFEKIWKKYFDLERDYSAIKKKLSERDEVIRRAIAYGEGIRILNQEKWETLISFIISQNNNIPRIKKCINSLAENFGEKAGEADGKEYFSLPSPQRLASLTVEDLSVCRLGYRAKYLVETARKVAEEGRESLDRLGSDKVSRQEAFDALRQYCGVGPKVANCILLFSMGKFDSFPIDVWVKKVMNRLYGIDESRVKEMADFAERTFGEYGGIAQQYLFYYITHSKEL